MVITPTEDLAEQFRTYSHWTPCYRTFKKELYEYLTDSIDLKSFNDKLYKQLQHTLEHNDAQKVNEVLLLKTSKKIVGFSGSAEYRATPAITILLILLLIWALLLLLVFCSRLCCSVVILSKT